MIVVIPSIGISRRLYGVVAAALASEAEMTLVIENQTVDGEKHKPTAREQMFERYGSCEPKLTLIGAPSKSLYGVWNMGLDYARMSQDPIAVILNDDVEITSTAINLLGEALRQRDEYAVIGANYFTRFLDPVPEADIREVNGTYRKGGIGGFAFACRADRCRVDEEFEWWGGDDDLVNQAMQAYWKIGIHEGAPVRHPEPETSAIHFPELLAAKDRDRIRMRAKWGESW